MRRLGARKQVRTLQCHLPSLPHRPVLFLRADRHDRDTVRDPRHHRAGDDNPPPPADLLGADHPLAEGNLATAPRERGIRNPMRSARAPVGMCRTDLPRLPFSGLPSCRDPPAVSLPSPPLFVCRGASETHHSSELPGRAVGSTLSGHEPTDGNSRCRLAGSTPGGVAASAAARSAGSGRSSSR